MTHTPLRGLQTPVKVDCFLTDWLQISFPLPSLPLDSINLLERPTELRKTFHLPDDSSCCKGREFRNSRVEGMLRARFWERVLGSLARTGHDSSQTPTVHQTGSSPNWPFGFCGGFITPARLIKSLAVGDWFNPRVGAGD